jgi:hypothetical protein
MVDPRWACQKCKGEGMYPAERGYALCNCPAGQSKLRYLRMSEKEKRKERAKRKREKEAERVPF